jgi:hypothetical protein
MSKFDLKQIQKASVINPKTMLLFSYPKVGKTELCTRLKDYLIIDFEHGTDYYDAKKVNIDSVDEFGELKAQFEEENPFFDVLILDTITTMYDVICNPIAVSMFNKETGSKRELNWDIRKLDYGKGIWYLRESMQLIINFFKRYCNTLILSGHVADKAIMNETGTTNIKDIDIEGKLKSIIAVKVDAVGFLYRKEPKKNYVSFITNSELIGGTRSDHLANKEFLISEKTELGEFITYWDDILLKDK